MGNTPYVYMVVVSISMQGSYRRDRGAILARTTVVRGNRRDTGLISTFLVLSLFMAVVEIIAYEFVCLYLLFYHLVLGNSLFG